MKIAAVTITYNRPELLGRLIHCFERQSLPLEQREMVILDDSGQYPSQPSGPGWRVISHSERYPSLGAKRNTAISMVSPDVDAIAPWDDDDTYLPDALAACEWALQDAPWAQARHILEWKNGGREWMRCEAFGRSNVHSCAYHGAWCYQLAAFKQVGGYPETGEEDNPLANALTATFGISKDSICPLYPDPWYVYSRGNMTGMNTATTYHVSDTYQHLLRQHPHDFHSRAWELLHDPKIQPVAEIPVGWDRDYLAIPIPKKARPRVW